jgi:transcriptional regulator with XRE-family HTH domain
MTFIEHYEQRCGERGERPLAWMQEVADATGMTPEAVYQWGKGFRIPNASSQRIIAELLGQDIDTLFPNLKNQRQ